MYTVQQTDKHTPFYFTMWTRQWSNCVGTQMYKGTVFLSMTNSLSGTVKTCAFISAP